MEENKYLPLGSIVIMNGGVKKLMIVTRAVAAKYDGGMKNFDYGACFYPEGIAGENLLYFNHEDIFKIVAKGYQDEDDTLMQTHLQKWTEENGYERANIEEVRKRQREELGK